MMKHQPRNHPAPPLTTWVLAAVIATAGLVALAILGEEPLTPPPDAFVALNEPRAAAFSKDTGEHSYRVLMLGNSRLKYATGSRADLEQLTQETEGLSILRLVNDWATFSDFEPFIETMLEHPPDLVVMQLDLMSLERSTVSNVRFLRLYIKWLLLGARGELWNPGYLDQAMIQHETPCQDIAPTAAAVEDRINRTSQWLTRDPAGKSSAAARRFIEELRRRGTRVAFLTIPRTGAMEEALPEAALTAGSLSEEDRAALWRYPHPIPDESFCDTIHLSDSGRQPFSTWLTERILATRTDAMDTAIASTEPR